MQSLRQDVVSCTRLIQQSPGFAAVTVLTLALGIGANTAIFSILDALTLRKLPVWRPDRLVQVAAVYRNGATVPVSFPAFQQLQQNQRVLSDLFGWTPGSNYNLEVDGELFPTSVRGVTGNYYGTLGAAARRKIDRTRGCRQLPWNTSGRYRLRILEPQVWTQPSCDR